MTTSEDQKKKAIIIVTAAGNKECNGTYTANGLSRGRPKWQNEETGAKILFWGGSCGWEMYDKYSSFTCRYWTGQTDDNTFPWSLKGSKWIVRPGNEGMEPPPTLIGKSIIGSKIEQQLFAEFLTNKLRIPKVISQLPWLYGEIVLE